MSKDVIVREEPNHAPAVPFQRVAAPVTGSINAGAVAIESERAIAEAQGQLTLAKKFPRNEHAALQELLEACKLPALAEVAFYSVPQGGGRVEGPSIRLAEEIARVYGNFEFGHRELSRIEAGPGPRDFGRSEVEVYAWDKEKNNRSIRQITVLHTVDTKDGPKKLTNQRDIDNKIANVASKQVRGRILALLPKWMVEAAVRECKKTIAGQNDVPISERVRKMQQAFSKYGITVKHLEEYLGHALSDTTSEEIADLTGVYNAIREGVSPSEYFSLEKDQPADNKGEEIAAIAQRNKAAEEPQQQAEQPAPQPSAKPARKQAVSTARKEVEPEEEVAKEEAKQSPPQQEEEDGDVF